MQKQFRTVIFISLILTAAAIILRPLKVFAASGSVGFVLEDTDIAVNQTFGVYLTIDADTQIGDFNCYIYYDETKIEFYKGSDSVAGGDGVLKISVVNATSTSDSKKILIKFIALAPGNVVFSVTNPVLYEFERGTEISLMTSDLTVSIAATADESDDSSLKSLRVSPGTLEPAFSGDVFDYTVRVSKDTGSIYVSAIANDTEKAKVRIYGNDKLYPGENSVSVIVTAENGTMSEYHLKVIRDDGTSPTSTPTPSPTPSPTPAPEPEEKGFEWKIEAYDSQGNTYIAGSYVFEVINNAEGYQIPAGYKKTKIIISGHSVEVYSPDAEQDSDFVLLILRREGSDAAIYRYDRAEKTIQRFVQEDIVIRREEGTGTVSEEVKNKLDEYSRTISLMGLGIAVAVGLWLLTALGFVYYIKRSKGYDDLDE